MVMLHEVEKARKNSNRIENSVLALPNAYAFILLATNLNCLRLGWVDWNCRI